MPAVRIVAFLLLSALMMPAVHAQGRQLLEECSQVLGFANSGVFDDAGPGASYCLGMVKGMLTMNTIYQKSNSGTALFCLPATTVTNAEGARIVVDYLNSHPDQLDLDSGSLMFFAFRDAFPCPGTP